MPQPSSETRSTTAPSSSPSSSSAVRALRVAGDVGQALLGHAVDREVLVGAEHGQVGRRARGARAGRCGPEALRERGQRAAQAELLQRRRAAARARSRAPARHRRAPPPAPPRSPPCRSAGARRWISSKARTTPVSVWPTSSCSSRATRSALALLARPARGGRCSWRSASRRSSMSLNARGQLGHLGGGLADHRPGGPGSCGSTRRIVPVRRSSGTEDAPQQQDVERDHEHRAADQHLDLRRRRRRAHAGRGHDQGEHGADHHGGVDDHDAPEQGHPLQCGGTRRRCDPGRSPSRGWGRPPRATWRVGAGARGRSAGLVTALGLRVGARADDHHRAAGALRRRGGRRSRASACARVPSTISAAPWPSATARMRGRAGRARRRARSRRRRRGTRARSRPSGWWRRG